MRNKMSNPSTLAAEGEIQQYDYDKAIADAVREYAKAQRSNAFERSQQSFNREVTTWNRVMRILELEQSCSDPSLP
jgi:hypothetical protein